MTVICWQYYGYCLMRRVCDDRQKSDARSCAESLGQDIRTHANTETTAPIEYDQGGQRCSGQPPFPSDSVNRDRPLLRCP